MGKVWKVIRPCWTGCPTPWSCLETDQSKLMHWIQGLTEKVLFIAHLWWTKEKMQAFPRWYLLHCRALCFSWVQEFLHIPAHPANTEPCRHHGFPHLSLSWQSAVLHRTLAAGCSPSSLEELWKDQASIASNSTQMGNTDVSGVSGSLLSHLQMSAPVLTSIFSYLFYCLLSEVGKTISISNLLISHDIISLAKSRLTVKLVTYPPWNLSTF